MVFWRMLMRATLSVLFLSLFYCANEQEKSKEIMAGSAISLH